MTLALLAECLLTTGKPQEDVMRLEGYGLALLFLVAECSGADQRSQYLGRWVDLKNSRHTMAIESNGENLIDEAFRTGEMGASTRAGIEAGGADLLFVLNEPMGELKSNLDDPVQHTEWLGSGKLPDDLRKRYQSLEEPIAEITLCINA